MLIDERNKIRENHVGNNYVIIMNVHSSNGRNSSVAYDECSNV